MVGQDELDPHREGDRHLDVLAELSEEAGLYDEWDDEPTHEKWRRGAKWS